jgi:hypothetical protein
MTLTFDPSIANGESCLSMAEDALIHNVSFTIQGKATLVPIDWVATPQAGNSTSPAKDPTNVGTLVSQAAASQAGAYSPTPFTVFTVGILLTSIDSCSEGTIVPPPPPPPPPLQWFNVTEEQTGLPVASPFSSFAVDSDGSINSAPAPKIGKISDAELSALNAAITAIQESQQTPSPLSSCTPPGTISGVVDFISIESEPSCPAGPQGTCLLPAYSDFVYSFVNGSVCYSGDQKAIDNLRTLLNSLENEYL